MIEDQITVSSTVSPDRNHIPIVSIGMPAYNDEIYIREALDSILAQTFTNFELIISDNASTDKTADICDEYAERDPRIRCVRQISNLGSVSNFQFVLSEARGKYFMWAACDDRRTSKFLEQTVAILENDEGSNLAFSNFIERNLETGEERCHQVLPSNSKSAIYNYTVRTLNMSPSLIYGLHRRDTIKDIKFLAFDFSDVHLIAEIALKTRIHVINDFLYIAGTKGVRTPYSFTYKKINRTVFLRKQYELLKKYFHFPITLYLFCLVCLVMAYNKARLWRY